MTMQTQIDGRLEAVNPLRKVFDAVRMQHARYRSFVRTRSELTGLSDRGLGDLGIDRDDIRSVALDAAHDTGR